MLKKQKNNIFLKILFVILIVLVIIMYYLGKQNIKQSESIVNEGTKNEEIREETKKYAIDLEKKENVKIENQEKINISEKLKEEKSFEGLIIKDIELKTDSGITKFTAKIQNNTENDFPEKKVTIIFTNQDDTEYARLTCEIPSVNKGQTNLINVKTTADIANAYNFRITN